MFGTFGPGTSFRGAASHTILIHLFAGNGEVTIEDHLAIGRTAHTVDTKPLGRITDQTLAQSGPLTFEVDITNDVRALLSDGANSIGVVFRTTDSGSATSLDNLGEAGSGPPGVNGSFLPYLVIDVEAQASPTPPPTYTAVPVVSRTVVPVRCENRSTSAGNTPPSTAVLTLSATV